jgi:hypothetical protein
VKQSFRGFAGIAGLGKQASLRGTGASHAMISSAHAIYVYPPAAQCRLAARKSQNHAVPAKKLVQLSRN